MKILSGKKVKALTDERNRLEADRHELEEEVQWRRHAMENVKSICEQDVRLKNTTNPTQILLAMELAEPGDWN